MNANPSASPYVNDLQNKVRVCRSNLLLAVAFTLINIVLLASKSTRYFLFSLVVPYRFVLNGMLFGEKFSGLLPCQMYRSTLDNGIGTCEIYIFKYAKSLFAVGAMTLY